MSFRCPSTGEWLNKLVCVCVYVCVIECYLITKRNKIYSVTWMTLQLIISENTQYKAIHTHIYTACVCVCVCVCMHDSIYGHFLNDKILETKDSLVVGQRWRRNYQEEDGCDKKGPQERPLWH